MTPIRLILNGKKAAIPELRQSIFHVREHSHATIDVRVTWESGDVLRLIMEAVAEGCRRIVIGGGDGTVKESVEALMTLPFESRPEIALLPLGTANDFATGLHISSSYKDALHLALSGEAKLVECVSANDEYFINVASGGFGAAITASTPVELKNFLGGGAYTLHGLVKALGFTPYEGKVILPDNEFCAHVVVAAVCNGSQAGGGQILAREAKVDDGLMDVVWMTHFKSDKAMLVIRDVIQGTCNSGHVMRVQVPWVEWRSDTVLPINLDGEPISSKQVRFECQPKQIKLVQH